MRVVVDVKDCESVILRTFAEFDADKVLVITPTVVKGGTHSVPIVVGIKIPFALSCVASIFFHCRVKLKGYTLRKKDKEAYASLLASVLSCS